MFNHQLYIKRLVDSVQQVLLVRHKHSVDSRRIPIHISRSSAELLDKMMSEIVALRRQLHGDVNPDRPQITFEILLLIEKKIA